MSAINVAINGWAMTSSKQSLRWLAIVFVLLFPVVEDALAAAPPFPGATSEYKAWIAAKLPGNPEGLAVDADGTMYTSLWESGRIVRLDGKGGYQIIATIPSKEIGSAGLTAGMEFGKDGKLYVAFMWNYSEAEEADPFHPACRNSKDLYTGVYQVDVHTGAVKPFLTKKDGWTACFPDDIAVDAKGNMYVTDLTLSGIWKIAPDGKYSLWSTDPLLQWAPAPFNETPEGANDLVITKDGTALYVATDGNPMIVRVPIKADGSAGAATIVARDLSLTDGVELDERGNIYVSEPNIDEIAVYSPDGNERIVIATAETAPITNPTSLVYRNGVLCTANMGMGPNGSHKEPRSIACISGFKRPGK